jgi:hypothetical protein
MTADLPTPLFRIEFADHPQLGRIEPCIEAAAIEGTLDDDAIIAASKQMLSFAALAVAGLYVDPNALQTDNEYMARNSEVANQLRPSAVRLVPESIGLPESAKFTSYLLEGLDSEQRDWMRVISACCEEDAKFQARWQMALEGAPGVSNINNHVAAMERAIVTRCIVTVTLDPEIPTLPQP